MLHSKHELKLIINAFSALEINICHYNYICGHQQCVYMIVSLALPIRTRPPYIKSLNADTRAYEIRTAVYDCQRWA